MPQPPATVALCFFGITRSLRFTLPSIETNILGPLVSATAVSGRDLLVYAHFFDQARIDNPRSGESGEMARDEHRLLATDWLRLEPPATVWTSGSSIRSRPMVIDGQTTSVLCAIWFISCTRCAKSLLPPWKAAPKLRSSVGQTSDTMIAWHPRSAEPCDIRSVIWCNCPAGSLGPG